MLGAWCSWVSEHSSLPLRCELSYLQMMVEFALPFGLSILGQ